MVRITPPTTFWSEVRIVLALLLCGAVVLPEAGKIGAPNGERAKLPRRLSRR